MKTTLRVLVLGVSLVSLALCAGCGEERANAQVPPPTNPGLVEIDPTKELASPPPAPVETTNAVAKEIPPAPPVGAATNVVKAGPVNPAPDLSQVSPSLAEVVKLVQAGLSEEVILAYVTNSVQLFSVGSAEILYLHDLGVSATVITALIQRDASPDSHP